MNSASSSETNTPRDLAVVFSKILSTAESIRHEAVNDANKYPIYAPTYGTTNDDHESAQARIAATNSMTKLYRTLLNEEPLQCGLLCVSESLANQINTFNLLKEKFCHLARLAHAFQGVSTRENSSRFLTRYLCDAINKYEISIDGRAKQELFLNSLDMNSMRSKIRIMPRNLDTFSWTWASMHSSRIRIDRNEAIELIKLKLDPIDQDIAMEKIEACQDPFFCVLKRKGEQLRVNYIYFNEGEKVRKQTPISGIAVARQEYLPRVHWKNPPSTLPERESRLSRDDSSLDQEPFIPEANLHRYFKYMEQPTDRKLEYGK